VAKERKASELEIGELVDRVRVELAARKFKAFRDRHLLYGVVGDVLGKPTRSVREAPKRCLVECLGYLATLPRPYEGKAATERLIYPSDKGVLDGRAMYGRVRERLKGFKTFKTPNDARKMAEGSADLWRD